MRIHIPGLDKHMSNESQRNPTIVYKKPTANPGALIEEYQLGGIGVVGDERWWNKAEFMAEFFEVELRLVVMLEGIEENDEWE